METKQFCYRKANFQISKAPTFVEDSSKKLKKIKNKSNVNCNNKLNIYTA